MKATKLLLFCIIIINSFSSCYQDTGEFIRTYSIGLTADSNEKKRGEIIELTVDTDSGFDVSSEAKFYYKEINTENFTELNDRIITSTIPITFIVFAKYKNFTSKEIEVKFVETDESFVKKVLIEDYTGAWCVNCPAVSYAIEKLKEQTDKAVSVAIHRGSTTAAFDPYHYEAATPLLQQLNIIAFPTAKLNRSVPWPFPQYSTANLNKAIALTTGTPVRLGLAMNSTISGNSINLDVKVKFLENYSNLKLVVYVLENGLLYPQDNGTTFYGGLSVIEEFEHDHVLRATFTNILGDAIPSNETTYGKTFTRNFSVAVPSNIVNTANMEFVAFVVGQDNKAVNVRKSSVGENQTFEENN